MRRLLPESVARPQQLIAPSKVHLMHTMSAELTEALLQLSSCTDCCHRRSCAPMWTSWTISWHNGV